MTGLYENHEDGHNKFWELRKFNGQFKAQWGKCGGKVQGTKFYGADEAEKIVASKLKKGYVKVKS